MTTDGADQAQTTEPDVNMDFDFPDSGQAQEPVESVGDDPRDVGQSDQNLAQEVAPSAPVEEPTSQPEPSPTEEPSTEEALRQQLSDLMGVVAAYKQKELEAQPSQPSPEVTFQPPAPGQVAELDFLQGEDHVSILEDPKKFNALLCKVATTAYTAAVNASQEAVMRKIPSVVSSAAQQQSTIERITSEFYAANQDLIPFKTAVSMAAMQLYNENPNLALPDLLAQASERTRKVLRIQKGAAPRKRTPAQPAGNSVRGGLDRTSVGGEQLTGQEQQILDLLTL